jgi:hypothetical protein
VIGIYLELMLLQHLIEHTLQQGMFDFLFFHTGGRSDDDGAAV